MVVERREMGATQVEPVFIGSRATTAPAPSPGPVACPQTIFLPFGGGSPHSALRLAPVDSTSLTPGQLAKVRQDVMRQAQYLYRLTDRMERQQFPTPDERRVKGLKARRA